MELATFTDLKKDLILSIDKLCDELGVKDASRISLQKAVSKLEKNKLYVFYLMTNGIIKGTELAQTIGISTMAISKIKHSKEFKEIRETILFLSEMNHYLPTTVSVMREDAKNANIEDSILKWAYAKDILYQGVKEKESDDNTKGSVKRIGHDNPYFDPYNPIICETDDIDYLTRRERTALYKRGTELAKAEPPPTTFIKECHYYNEFDEKIKYFVEFGL